MNVTFPLTLTLSRREREQPLAHFVKYVSREAAYHRCLAKKLGTILPLPKGEGWGEGKLGDQLVNVPLVSGRDMVIQNQP